MKSYLSIYLPIVVLSAGVVAGIPKLTMLSLAFVLLFLILQNSLFSKENYQLVGWLSALAIIALIWTFPFSDLKTGLKALETYTIALFLPLVMVKGRFTLMQLEHFLKIYCLVVLAAYVYALGVATYNFFFETHPYFQSEYFFYTDLALPISKAHPVYLALAGAIACIIALRTFPQNICLFLYVTFVTLVMILLNARSVLIIHVTLTFAVIFHSIIGAKRYKIVGLAILGCLLISIFLGIVSEFHSKPNRSFLIDISDAVQKSHQSDISSLDNGLTVRLAIARVATEIIADHFWFGIGTANERTELLKHFNAKQLQYLAEQKFNAHNQYLSFLITFGVVGTSLLVFAYTTQIAYVIKKGGPYLKSYLLFMTLIAIAMCTESLLYRFHGIALFTYANTLLFLLIKKK